MSDVCIVYPRSNAGHAGALVDLLSPMWDVWWDDKIVGDFAEAIEREIPQAKCVVPIWSMDARKSGNVRDELRLAQQNGVPMIPVKVEDCSAPYGFGGLSSVDLRGWRGDADHPGFRQLLRRLSTIALPRAKPMRPHTIAEGRLPLPALFLSVSSHETQLVPIEAVKALRLFQVPTILISAYDLVPSRHPRGMQRELSRFRAKGGLVLVDSGNYEATRRGDEQWSTNDLKLALASVPHDWAFCFDVMQPSRSVSKAVDQVVAAVERDQAFTSAPILPIVHARRARERGHSLEEVPDVIRGVADRLQPLLVAVPERELGPGLIARAQTVWRIREELDKLPFYQPLHLLGTGNPWSIAVLAAAGADSFDGLEWCRIVVDRDTGRLNHFHHFDFFSYQARLADSPVAAGAVEDENIDFAGKVAFHNLDFFADFGMRLRQAAAKRGFEAFVVGLLGQANTTQLSKQMSKLFE